MAKDKSKSLVLTIHLAKATMYTLYTDFKKRRQINIDVQRTNTSNAIIHTHNKYTKKNCGQYQHTSKA